MTKTFSMTVVMNDVLDNYEEEDIVKNVWPGMYTFLTRRRGINNGTITLADNAVQISWKYEDTYEEPQYSEDLINYENI